MTALENLIVTTTGWLEVTRQRTLDCTGHCEGVRRDEVEQKLWMTRVEDVKYETSQICAKKTMGRM